MKIIEKTCPSCGASLDIVENAKTIKCKYCNKTFMVEKDHDDVTLELTEQASKIISGVFTYISVVHIISAIIFFIIFICVIIGIIYGVTHF